MRQRESNVLLHGPAMCALPAVVAGDGSQGPISARFARWLLNAAIIKSKLCKLTIRYMTDKDNEHAKLITS